MSRRFSSGKLQGRSAPVSCRKSKSKRKQPRFPAIEPVVMAFLAAEVMAKLGREKRAPRRIGTAAYMAPEQQQGKPRRASDQYALGIVVYE